MTVKIALWGVGAMALRMADMLLDRTGVTIVGAIDRHPDKVGRDVALLAGRPRGCGVAVSEDVDAVLARRPDVVLHATDSFVDAVAPDLHRAVEAGANVITIAEEMAWPDAADPVAARALDAAARAAGVTLLGTGVNPGFVMDSLVLALTGACASVRAIHVGRVNDLSQFGPTVMRTQGVGLSADAFAAGVADGSVVGHVGFRQSIGMIAAALGWRIDRIEETRDPIISDVRRETPHVTVEPGMVAGCRHVARGYRDDDAVIVLEHPQQVRPELAGVETGDTIRIDGAPSIRMASAPEIPGGAATAALAVNMIPRVLAAPPGLATMADLPIPTAWTVLDPKPAAGRDA